MRRTALTMFTMFLATALASSVLVFVLSGSSRAEETSSGATELTESPVPTSPGKDTPKADVIPALEEKFPAYSDVVDNSVEKKFEASEQATESGKPGSYGKDYEVLKPSGKAEPVRYSVKIPADDTYSVYAWWPEKLVNASARIGVQTDSGTEWSTVDQDKEGGYWVPVGEYEMEKDDQSTIQVAPTSESDSVAVADSVAVVRGVSAFPPAPPESKIGGTEADEATFSGAASAAKRIPKREVMRRARLQIGTRYGNSRCVQRVQEDCSCFTRIVYRPWRTLPDSPKWQWRYGFKVPKSRLKQGDLLFFDMNGDRVLGHWDHVALYAGNGYVIHANNYYKYRKVHKQKMKYIRGYMGAKRLNYYR